MTQSNLLPFPDMKKEEGKDNRALEVAFEEVWKLWPNKAKKPLARAKFIAICNGCKTRTMDRDSGQYMEIELQSDPQEIIDGCKAYLSSQIDKRTFKMKDDGKFIPHLSTFLNGGRYEDFL